MQGILLELPLASFFLKKLLRMGCDLHDLPSLDAELYKSLLFLRDYEGDMDDLALSFTVTDGALGQNREVCLGLSGPLASSCIVVRGRDSQVDSVSCPAQLHGPCSARAWQPPVCFMLSYMLPRWISHLGPSPCDNIGRRLFPETGYHPWCRSSWCLAVRRGQ